MSVQHELSPGVAVTAGYYHRHFQNLAIPTPAKEPASISETRTTPRTRSRRRETAGCPNGGGEVITRYNLNPPKQADAARQCQHVFDVEHAGIRRDRSERQRAVAARRLRVWRDHDAADRHQRVRHRQQEPRTDQRSAIRCRRSARSTKPRLPTRCRTTCSSADPFKPFPARLEAQLHATTAPTRASH